MKRRDIVISAAIIAAALLASYIAFRQKGYVTLEPPGATLTLGNAFFSRSVSAWQSRIELPARAYKPRVLKVSRELAGNTWQLTSTGPWGELTKIRVTPDGTTSLKVGPPFRIVPETTLVNGTVYVQFHILGAAGERYTNSITRNGKGLPAPRLKILDREGNVLAAGQFAYG